MTRLDIESSEHPQEKQETASTSYVVFAASPLIVQSRGLVVAATAHSFSPSINTALYCVTPVGTRACPIRTVMEEEVTRVNDKLRGSYEKRP